MRNIKRKATLALAGMSMVLFAGLARADETKSTDQERYHRAALALVQSLLNSGVITKQQADTILRDMDQSGSTASSDNNTVRVPYIPEFIKDEIRDELKKEVMAQAKREGWGAPSTLPDWITRIKWEGELRLRYQEDLFSSKNYPFLPDYLAINSTQNASTTSTPFLNTTIDKPLYELRARLGMLAAVTDKVSVGIRLSTGNSTTPVSANYTLGDMNNRAAVLFDEAFVKADPLSWVTAIGGRIPNPWFSSDLIWADDLSFDGMAVFMKPKFRQDLGGFLTIGAFPLQYDPFASHDKWLYGAQTGTEWSHDRLRAKLGVAYYDYQGITGVQNAVDSHLEDYTAPTYLQQGNTLFNISQDPTKPDLYALAADYRDLDIMALLDIMSLNRLHVVFAADYVQNVGYDQEEIERRTGPGFVPPAGWNQTNGYLLKASVGMPVLNDPKDWQVYLGYKRVEADAVLDAFDDPNFHLGGTNAKGWILGGAYCITHNTLVNLRWLSADQISGPAEAIDVLQLDFNVKF